MGTAAENTRAVVTMQERRLDVYEQQLVEFDEANINEAADYIIDTVNLVYPVDNLGDDENALPQPGERFEPFHQVSEALGVVERLADGLGLHVDVFSSQAPMLVMNGAFDGYALYDVRVSAVYREQVDALTEFIQLLDGYATRVLGLHMEFLQDGDALLRLHFSLFAFSARAGIE